MKTQDIGFGILGSGMMAAVYAEALATQVDGGRLAAVALGRRAAQLAADYDVEEEDSVEALINRDDVEVVVIATPHSTHRPLALATAASGRHVYLEKPMALDVAECDDIIAACGRSGVVLTVAKQTRYMEMATRAKSIIDDGVIGEIRVVRPMSPLTGWGLPDDHWLNQGGEGDCFLDWGAHCCDALRWYTGSEPERVFADFANYTGLPATGPTACVQYRMRNGVLAQVFLSYEIPPPGIGTNSNNQYQIIGSEGIVEWDLDRVRLGRGDTWETIDEQPSWTHPWQPKHPRRIGNSARQVQQVVDQLGDGQQRVVTGEDGRAAIEMTEGASRSAASGQAVTFPLGG